MDLKEDSQSLQYQSSHESFYIQNENLTRLSDNSSFSLHKQMSTTNRPSGVLPTSSLQSIQIESPSSPCLKSISTIPVANVRPFQNSPVISRHRHRIENSELAFTKQSPNHYQSPCHRLPKCQSSTSTTYDSYDQLKSPSEPHQISSESTLTTLSNTSDTLTVIPTSISPKGSLITNYYTPRSNTQVVHYIDHNVTTPMGSPTLFHFHQPAVVPTVTSSSGISNECDSDPVLLSQLSRSSSQHQESIDSTNNDQTDYPDSVNNNNQNVKSFVPTRSIPPLAIQAALNLSSLRVGTPRTPHTPVSSQGLYSTNTPHLLLRNGTIPIHPDHTHIQSHCHSTDDESSISKNGTLLDTTTNNTCDHLLYSTASSRRFHSHGSTSGFTDTTVWTSTTQSTSNEQPHDYSNAPQLCFGYPSQSMTSFLIPQPPSTTNRSNQPPIVYEGTPVCLQDQHHSSSASSEHPSPLIPSTVCCIPAPSPESTSHSISVMHPIINNNQSWCVDLHKEENLNHQSSDNSSFRTESYIQPQFIHKSLSDNKDSVISVNTSNSHFINYNENHADDLNYDSTIDSATNQQSYKQTMDEPSTALLCDPIPVRLFVGRIPKSYRSCDLKKIFDRFGLVLECNIIRDRRSFQSKGCGFVRLTSVECATNAIKGLNQIKQFDCDLEPLQVKFASGELERLGLPFSMQPGGECVKVFFGNLASTTTEEELHSIFSRFGEYEEFCILRDRNRRSKCSGFITFRSMSAAQLCINSLDGQHQVMSAPRRMEVRLAESRSQRGNKAARIGSNSMTHHHHHHHHYFHYDLHPLLSSSMMSNNNNDPQLTSLFYDRQSQNNDEWGTNRPSSPPLIIGQSSLGWASLQKPHRLHNEATYHYFDEHQRGQSYSSSYGQNHYAMEYQNDSYDQRSSNYWNHSNNHDQTYHYYNQNNFQPASDNNISNRQFESWSHRHQQYYHHSYQRSHPGNNFNRQRTRYNTNPHRKSTEAC